MTSWEATWHKIKGAGFSCVLYTMFPLRTIFRTWWFWTSAKDYYKNEKEIVFCSHFDRFHIYSLFKISNNISGNKAGFNANHVSFKGAVLVYMFCARLVDVQDVWHQSFSESKVKIGIDKKAKTCLDAWRHHDVIRGSYDVTLKVQILKSHIYRTSNPIGFKLGM